MPVQLLSDDPMSFTVDSGNGPQQIAKTPDMMAPGGIYDQAKASQAAPPMPEAPMGVSQPPPPPPVLPAAPAPLMQSPPTPAAPVTPANQIPMMSAQNAPADPPPVSPPQMQPPQSSVPAVFTLGQTGMSTSSNIVDPKARAGYEAAMGDQSAALQEQGKIKGILENNLAKNDEAKAKIQGEQANVEQDRATMIAQHHDEYKKRVADELQTLATQKVQPKPIFEDGALGQNLAAGLAIGLGALGQAMSNGRENVGLSVIQTAIDRDMKAQQANIDNKRASLNELGVALKAGLDMGMSQKDAQLHAKAAALGQVATMAEQMGHKAGSEMAVQNGLQLGAAAKAAQNEMIMKTTGTTVSRSRSDSEQPMAKLMGKGPQIPPETHKTLQSAVAADRAYKDIADTYEIAHAKGLTGPLDGRMQQIAAKFGIQAVDAADFQQKLQGQLSLRLHDLFGGAVSEGERKSFDGVFPSGTDLPKNFMVKLNNLRATNARTYRDTLDQYKGQKDYTPVPLVYDAENPSNSQFKPATK